MVSLSFQPNGGLLGATPSSSPRTRRPRTTSRRGRENSFSHYFVNSLFVAIWHRRDHGRSSPSLAAFAFARYRFPFKELIFYVFLASLAVPEPAAADPAVPADGPAPPARLALRA